MENYNTGVSLIELNRFNESISWFEKAIIANENPLMSWSYLAFGYLQEANFKEAQKMAEGGLKLNATYPLLLSYLSVAYLNQKKYKAAHIAIDSALDQDPLGRKNQFGLKALIFFHEKKYSQSISWCKKGLKNDPQNARCLSILSLSEARLGNNKTAYQAAQKSLNIDPNGITSSIGMAWFELRHGRRKEAERLFSLAYLKNQNDDPVKKGLKLSLRAKFLPFKWFLRLIFWNEQHIKSTISKRIVFLTLFLILASAFITTYFLSKDVFIAILSTLIFYIVTPNLIIPLTDFLLINNYKLKNLLSKKEKIRALFVGTIMSICSSGILLSSIVGNQYAESLLVSIMISILPILMQLRDFNILLLSISLILTLFIFLSMINGYFYLALILLIVSLIMLLRLREILLNKAL